MKKKKVYNIQEDVEMQKLFQEYYLLNDWWQTVKKELEEKKKRKEPIK